MLDSLSLLENTPTKETLSILGVPMDHGKDDKGTHEGPNYLRYAGLNAMLKKVGIASEDLGNLICATPEAEFFGDKSAKFVAEIAETAEETAAAVQKEISKGNKMLVIGGDHTVSIGSVSGASRALNGDLGLIYIDAHPDAMTNANSISGNVHGMVTSSLMGLGHQALTDIGGKGIKIKPENILFIGLKDLDQPEIDLIRDKKLAHSTIHDIAAHGLSPTFEKIAALQKRVKNIWVSFDHDAIDSAFAPAHAMATPGGLTYREIIALAKYIGKVCQVAGFDSVELLPAKDQDQKTASLITAVIAHLLGAEYGWYTAYMDEEAQKQTRRGTPSKIDVVHK